MRNRGIRRGLTTLRSSCFPDFHIKRYALDVSRRRRSERYTRPGVRTISRRFRGRVFSPAARVTSHELFRAFCFSGAHR